MKDKTEAKIQSEIVEWFNNNFCLKFHKPRYCIFSVPNDTEDKEETMRKLATGLKRGASDLIVLFPSVPVFCEVKTQTGVQGEAQKDFQEQVEELGFDYILVRSLDDFKISINKYL